MTIKEALEVLRKQYNCWTTVSLTCPIQCEKCKNKVDFADFLEALKTVPDAFGKCSELPNSSDLVSRSYLLAEYDRQHEGPPGGARKIIEEAPAVLRNSEMSESLKFEEIGKSVRAGFESGIRNWFTDTEKDFEAAYSAQDFCSEDLKQKWIPCSKRLPNHDEYIKNNGLFIVSDGNRSYSEWYDIYDKRRFGEPTMSGFRIDYAVTAWMPLPEPCTETYKPEDDRTNDEPEALIKTWCGQNCHPGPFCPDGYCEEAKRAVEDSRSDLPNSSDGVTLQMSELPVAGVLVNGMQMPEDCISCKLEHDGWCRVTDHEAVWGERPEWCPLAEIKQDR